MSRLCMHAQRGETETETERESERKREIHRGEEESRQQIPRETERDREGGEAKQTAIHMHSHSCVYIAAMHCPTASKATRFQQFPTGVSRHKRHVELYLDGP